MNKCWICQRTFNSKEGRFPVSGPTGHHITPKQFKHRSRYELEKEDICKACHLQINKMFTNKELMKLGKKLLDEEKTKRWIKWIRKE
jgi:hypothetical protein